MTKEDIQSLLVGKVLIIDGKYLHFHPKGQLEITSTSEPVYGHYNFKEVDNKCYLSADVLIYKEKKEISIELMIEGNVSVIIDS